MKTHKFLNIGMLIAVIFAFGSCQRDEIIVNTGPLFIKGITVSGTNFLTGLPEEKTLSSGITKVPLDGVITIKVSKDIDAATLSSIAIMKSTTAIATTNQINGTTITITPSAPFDKGTKYKLVIGETLKASDGGIVLGQQSVVFSSAGGQFDQQVAYWAFQESLIDSVSLVKGTNKSTTFAAGLSGGKALSLDVANKSYVTFNPGAAITGLKSFTISYWVNPTFVDANADNGIDGVLGLVNLSNKSRFWGNIDWFVENGSNPTAAKIVAHITSLNQAGVIKETWMTSVSGVTNFFGAWSHLTLTYDAKTSTFTYYINGVVKATAISAWGGDTSFTNSGPMVFGCVQFQTIPSLTTGSGSQSWASYLTGLLDEIRIFDVALTGAEVQSLYNLNKP